MGTPLCKLTLLPRESVVEVLNLVAGRCQRRQMAYWVEPVDDFGRLV